MKKYLIVMICFCFLIPFTGCAKARKQPPFDKTSASAPLEENLIAENETYILEWNENNYGVILTNKLTGEVWGTSPEEGNEEKIDSFGMPMKRHEMVDSVLLVYYHNGKVGTDNNTINSYSGVVENGRVRCARIKNGVHVEYYFDSVEFMIPVDFVLYENYVDISVKTKLIQENSNTVTSISLAPFFCSVENDTPGAQLFVPSGSGALLDTSTYSLDGRKYLSPVYGEDLSKQKLYNPELETVINLPVFGADGIEKGVFAVIENAAETAYIEATSGSEGYNYSSVYPTFQVRGESEHQSTVFSGAVKTYIIYSEAMISEELQVRFYPLGEGKCNYSAMAETYRGYLKERGFLKNNAKTIPLEVELIGGSLIQKSFLGIPYTTVQATTTVKQASDIVHDLSDNLNQDFTVSLKGFGTSGADIGKIAGEFTVSKEIGSVSQIKELSSFCRKKKISLFMDFDVVRYASSGCGFSTFFDDVTNVGGQKTTCYVFDKATGMQKRSQIYYLLSPWKFDRAQEKLIRTIAKTDMGGVSLATLTTLSYSDYSKKETERYYAKANFPDAVSQFIKKVGKESDIMASSANDYAAVLSDVITNTPITSENNIAFIADVPFYQMVFKGYIPMFTECVNLAKDPETVVLKAVESGCGLSYSVISSWSNVLIDSDYNYFHSSVYADLKSTIFEKLQDLSDYYIKISDAHIVSNERVTNDVRLTIFDNGISVYVNYGNNPFKTSVGTVAPRYYLIKEGAM